VELNFWLRGNFNNHQEQKPGAPQPDLNQGPLKQMYGIIVNGPDIKKDGLKPCKWLKFMSKIFEKYFQVDNF
jgi:hypothetical protein